MPFPEMMVRPMREELTRIGLEELRDPAAVDAFLADARQGTALIAVNSTCGCAAGSMRPALAAALRRGPRPDRLASVFAGQDPDATSRARDHFTGYPPSSPCVALFRDGRLVWMLERSDIQGRQPEHLAVHIVAALERHAGGTGD
jgi:putative YphP/YqiW family bacilliredoxin